MKAKIVKLAASLIEDLNSLTTKSNNLDSDLENIRKDTMRSQVEPEAYSTALVLEQIRKQTEKEEAAAESAKLRCRVCFKEIAPTRRCFGHGGGGGGGDGSGSANSSNESASQVDDNSLSKTDSLVDEAEELIAEFSSMEGSEGLDSDSLLDEENFDPEIIAELIAKGLLVINNNRESMTLTIKLQCDPNSLSEEQREELKKFIGTIIKEFNAFKEEHQLSDDCINMIQDKGGNLVSLSISLPTLKLYDEFIQRLANNLVPAPNPKSPIKDKQKETKSFTPSPLPTKPKLSSNMQDEIKQNKDIAFKLEEVEDENSLILRL